MRLTSRILVHGNALFRWRSFVPLALLPFVLIAIPESERIDRLLGEEVDHAAFYACLCISYAGLAIRWLTVGFVPSGTSGRNTRSQRAAQLNTTGAYSLVRNPLYVGNFLAMLGIALSLKVWWLVLIFLLAYALYIERVVAAEEEYLAGEFGDAYESWAAATPAFVPRLGFQSWRPPTQAFSLLTVLRREYSGLFAVALTYLVLEFVMDVLIGGESLRGWVEADKAGLVVAGISLTFYLALRTLKKHTKLLRVRGR